MDPERLASYLKLRHELEVLEVGKDEKARRLHEHFTRDELRDMLHMAYRRFYWRPTFVARNLAQIRNPRDLLRKATAGIRLLTAD